MKFFIIFIINILIGLGYSQTLYGNFIPYQSEGCKGEIQGIGFSFTAGLCYSEISKTFNDIFNLNQDNQNYYYFDNQITSTSSNENEEMIAWRVLVDALRVGVAEYITDNSTCDGNFIYANSIKNGTCLNTPNFIPFIGSINNQNNLTQQYSLVTISKVPYYPNNVVSQVYSVYNSIQSNCNEVDLLYSIYLTNNLTITSKNKGDSEYLTTNCLNGIASNNICTSSSSSSSSSSNCKQITFDNSCNNINNDYGFDQIYCTN